MDYKYKMVVTTTAIKSDLGELYEAVEFGTTSINSMIERASDFVKLQTGTATGYDAVIRPLADAMITNTFELMVKEYVDASPDDLSIYGLASPKYELTLVVNGWFVTPFMVLQTQLFQPQLFQSIT